MEDIILYGVKGCRLLRQKLLLLTKKDLFSSLTDKQSNAMKTIEAHKLRLKILEVNLGRYFYNTGELHNAISDAMEEYAQYKVNELNKSDVIKSVCIHKNETKVFRRQEVWFWCPDCDEYLRQTVL